MVPRTAAVKTYERNATVLLIRQETNYFICNRKILIKFLVPNSDNNTYLAIQDLLYPQLELRLDSYGLVLKGVLIEL